jgi:uncharacterized protein (DUF697 family)
MRKIRKTKLQETPEYALDSAFERQVTALAEMSPEERLHYLGAAIHAAPGVLAVEATPMEADTRAASGDPGNALPLRAREVVMKSTLLACGLGLVPVPLVDVAGGTLTIRAMLKTLGELHGCGDDTWQGNATVALLATLGAIGGGGVAAGILLRLVPLGGAALARAVSPAALGVATYAVGMAAVQYFESEKRMTSPSLSELLAGARAGRKEAERKVATLI